MVRLAIYSTSFILFVNFCMLQMWRYIKAFENSSIYIMLPLSAVFFFGWCQLLIQSTDAGKRGPRQGDIFKLKSRDFLFLGLSVLFSFSFWYILVLPSLSRSMDVWGDEEHHFAVSLAVAEYFKKYFHLKFPQAVGPYSVLNPDSMYLSGLWFLNPFTGPVDTPFSQRISLLFPYLGTAAMTFLLSLAVLRKRAIALLFTLAYVSSPLLLCYTADKYLDIGHPFLFALSSFWVYQLIIKPSNFAALMSALSVSILFSVRQNCAPTTLLYSLVIFLYFSPKWGFGPKKERSWYKAFLYFSTAFLPLFVFVILKAIGFRRDTERLSLGHLFSQNYADFFSHFLLEIPLTCVLFLFLGVSLARREFHKSSLASRIGFGVIILSSLGQLAIYALFGPGWMPWSRNYLMFCGQMSICALIGVSELLRSESRWLRVSIVSLLISVLGFNLIFGGFELKSNRFFHENELHFDYQTLLSSIKTKSLIPKGSPIFSNFNDTTSLGYSAKQVGFQFEDNPTRFTGSLLSPFGQFVREVPEGEQYLLFHYRRPRTAMPILRDRFPLNDRPTESELKEYEVLLDLPDPFSGGLIGIVLLKRNVSSSARISSP